MIQVSRAFAQFGRVVSVLTVGFARWGPMLLEQETKDGFRGYELLYDPDSENTRRRNNENRVLEVPYYGYSTIYPKTPFELLRPNALEPSKVASNEVSTEKP